MNRLAFPIFACLTLGLAPFAPEPHVLGKLRWVLGGAHGMAAVDWFDLTLHGTPWLWLIIAAAMQLRGAKRQGQSRWPGALVLLAVAAALFCVLWSLLVARD